MLDIPVIIRLQFRVDMPYKYKKERMKHDHKSSTYNMRNITERADIHKGYRLFYVSML